MQYKYLWIFVFPCMMFYGEIRAHYQKEDSSEVSFRREPPGIRIHSYNSRELALREEDEKSLYMRSLNGEWRIKNYPSEVQLDSTIARPSLDDSSWEQIRIPQKEANSAWATVYRKEFQVPFKWVDRQIFIRLDGVTRAYDLYVNGHPAGYHEDSKTSAYFDITPYIKDGKNTVAVVVYAHPASIALENQISTQGTQMEGSVTAIAQPKVRIRDYVLDTRFAADGDGLFNFGVIVKSHLLNPKEVIVHYELIAPDDSTVISHGKRDARFHLRAEDTVRFFAKIPDIESWSHESPKLYTIALKLQHEGRFTEYTKFNIGFREVSYDQKGLKINGKPVVLCAVDYNCPKDEGVLRHDFDNFRKQGINCIRIKDFPQNDRFYDLTDRYGLYVCNQANIDTHLSGQSLAPDGNPANNPQWENAYVDRVMNMYYTSQNHPSVLLFSLGKNGGRGYNMYEAYRQLKKIESHRPVVYEEAGAEWNSDMVIGNPAQRNESDGRFTLHFVSPKSAQGTPVDRIASTTIEPGPTPGSITIHNGCEIANLQNFQIKYRLTAGAKRIVKEGLLHPDVPGQESGTIQIPLEGVKPGKYTLTLFISHKDHTPFSAQGEPIVQKSIPLEVGQTH